MRTKTRRISPDSSLRDLASELANKVMGKPEPFDRDYRVEGEIRLWLNCEIENADEVDKESLQSAILEIDKEFPWVDEALPHDEYQSIRYITQGQVVTHRHNPDEKVVCIFRITPYRTMRRNQVHAYERYLFNIGQQLVKKNLPDVGKVDVMPCWHSHKTFK